MPQPVTGQEVSVPEEPAPEKPAGIPITEVSVRAKETHITLNKTKANFEDDSDILPIKEQLPQFINSLKRSQSGWFHVSLNSLSTRKLQDLKQEWEANLEKLNKWEGILSERSREFEEDYTQLEKISELWQITSETAISSEAPEVIRNRIETTLKDIIVVNDIITECIKELLTIQDQIPEQQLEITKLISLISEAETHSRRHLFARDKLPLWKN
ncbi:MAG: hypothetical protein GY777_28060, partial [Candidatus Brocadiaceae bacterium]|nr:hypothetical protein [Candidatus Brocadiaceae bacterium]